MSIYFDFKQISDEPFRLSDTEMEDPHRVFLDFYSANSLGEIRGHLSSMLEVCATTDNDPFRDAESRSRLFTLHHGLERMLEACKIMADKRAVSEEYDHFD